MLTLNFHDCFMTGLPCINSIHIKNRHLNSFLHFTLRGRLLFRLFCTKSYTDSEMQSDFILYFLIYISNSAIAEPFSFIRGKAYALFPLPLVIDWHYLLNNKSHEAA